jgi:hypothetical protein
VAIVNGIHKLKAFVTASAGVLALAGLVCPPAIAERQIGPKARFVLDCYARVDKGGDPTVFKDCFTPDFRMSGPEMNLLSTSPDQAIHGEAAVDAMGAMNRNDDASFGTKDWKLVMSMED